LWVPKIETVKPFAVSKEHHLADCTPVLPTGNDLYSMMYSRIWSLFIVPASLKFYGRLMGLACIVFCLSWFLPLFYLFYIPISYLYSTSYGRKYELFVKRSIPIWLAQ
jgi:hypothetical protein